MAARYCRRAFDVGLGECDVGEDLIGGGGPGEGHGFGVSAGDTEHDSFDLGS